LDCDIFVKRNVETIDPKDLIGRIFMKDNKDSGHCFQACVTCAFIAKQNEAKKGSEYMNTGF
jgi:hypothetical protein